MVQLMTKHVMEHHPDTAKKMKRYTMKIAEVGQRNETKMDAASEV